MIVYTQDRCAVYIKNACRYIFILSVMLFSCLTYCRTAMAETIIQDDANIISDNEETSLYSLCEKVLEKYKTSVYIWTDPSISGSMDFEYEMEQFVATFHDTDVIILMIGMSPGDRIYEIQGYGTVQNMITDKRCSKILDDMQSDMVDGEYYSAIKKFCNRAYTYMGRPPMLDSPIFSPIVQLALCIVIGILTVVFIAYNSGGSITTDSRTYLDRNNSRVIGRFDRYTHTTVTRTPKPKPQSDNRSHSTSGSSHSSGGGRSF